MKKMKLKKVLLECLRFLLGILPITVFLIIFREKYFATTKGWSCFVYVAILITLIALKDTLSEALKRNAQFKVCLAIFAFSYFFKYVSSEMIWFSLMGAIGGALAIIPDYFIRELGKDIEAKRSGNATAVAFTEQALKVVKK